MANVAQLGGYGDTSNVGLMFRNRIINGDMSIYQRQAASTTNSSFALDHWLFTKVNGATESIAQNTDAPFGFNYSLRNTISVGDASIGATEYSAINQRIEGYNIRDLGFGTANARSVTIQFWVKATVTGSYTANIYNESATRICPFSYTIDNSNTWEFKTVTLPGCPDGTWNTTNGIGLALYFYAALGSSYLGGTSGVWNSSGQYGSGTPVNNIASNGNIFAITGVQLEPGSIPTAFEYLPFHIQLAQCQRYYEKSYNYDVAPGTATDVGVMYHLGGSDNGLNLGPTIYFKVMKRATPSVFTAYTRSGADGWDYGRNGGSGTITNALLTKTWIGMSGGLVYGNVGGAWVPAWINGHWVAQSEF